MKLSELLTSILDVAKELINTEASSILLADKNSGDLIFNVVIGEQGEILKGKRVPKGKGIAGSVAESGNHLIVNDAQNDPRFYGAIDKKTSFKTRNLICLPMIVIDEMVGVLEIVNKKNFEEFNEWDLKKSQYIADQAAIAIANRRLLDDLNNRIDEISSLYEVSQVISFSKKDDNLLSKIIDTLAESMSVGKISIIIFDHNINKLIIKASHGLDFDQSEDYIVSTENTIAGRVFSNSDPIIVTDLNNENHLPSYSEERNYITNSFISLPILYKNKTIGVLNLTDKKNQKHFNSFDLRILSTVCNQIAEVYQNILNQKEAESQKRLAQEIDIAAEIQKKILPVLPKKFNSHLLSAYNKPAKEVGGDFFDFFEFDENKYGVIVADISGKGIPAALFMGTARNVIRAEKRVDYSPGQLLTNANKLIYNDSESGMFVTLFYAVIDTHNNLITYGSAGHSSQILIKKETHEIVKLDAKGSALGIFEDHKFEEKVLIYDPGDFLVLFTDGVTELLGGDNLDIDIGEEKLCEITIEHIDKNPEELISYFKKYLNENEMDTDFRDDFTIFAIKF
jgi:serine phosphatase RsbU (regulator of sigma subunit)/putative methionine-R-sulfoxide reductase with GAF domain